MDQAEPKIKRRRSFVDVRRKSLLFDKIFSEDNELNNAMENSNSRIEKYLVSLKEERMQWKDILKLRLKQLEHLKNKCLYETTDIITKDVEYYLSQDDKDFLVDEPNYLSMMECANKYLKAVEFFKRYKSDVIEHYGEIVEEIKADTDMLVEHFSQCDTCELCNQINCNVISHKFPTY